MPLKYRADHVGSLLRPPELLEARKNPSIAPEQLKELEDRHIQRVLQRQKDLGFRIFTDGEFRRGGFMSDFNDSVEGLDNAEDIARDWKIEGSALRRPEEPAAGSGGGEDSPEEAAHRA